MGVIHRVLIPPRPEDRTLTDLLELADLGFRLFPVRGKTPLVKGWREVATTDHAKLAEWFDKPTPPNVGLATGDGLLVLDVDVDRGGFDSFNRFVAGRELPETAACESGSGGYHHFFRVPEGLVIRSRVDLLPGLDVRCEGGYVVTAPSVHPDTGREYEWASHPRDGVADAPHWMLAALVPKEGRPTACDGGPIDMELEGDVPTLTAEAIKKFAVPEPGRRNDVMLKLVTSLMGRNYDADTVESVVTAWWTHFHRLGKITTPPRRAKYDVPATINAILSRGSLQLQRDHKAEIAKVELTPTQAAWVAANSKKAQERAYLEAWILHATYELSKPSREFDDRFPATRDQIRNIMEARGCKAPQNPQMEVLKRRYIMRPDKPASRTEALVQVETGRTGKASWFRISGLPVGPIAKVETTSTERRAG